MDHQSPLFANNAAFIEELYQLYLTNPKNVDVSWQGYFDSLREDKNELAKSLAVSGNLKGRPKVVGVQEVIAPVKAKGAVNQNSDSEIAIRSVRAAKLIDAYRAYGHSDVKLDPLNYFNPQYHPELDYKTHGFRDEDLEKQVLIAKDNTVLLKDLVAYLKNIYCSGIAADFMHIESSEEREWIQDQLEARADQYVLTKDEKLIALEMTTKAEMFENYLHVKFPGTKRFSVEGLENSISALKFIVTESVKCGVEEFIFGMAHRGRLNVLTNIMGKSFASMFSEFKGELAFPKEMRIPGDVKYHLGASLDTEVEGKKVHMSLTPNPSHLEVVNAVVLGKVRAKQDLIHDYERSKVLGVLLHGDAAFAGQGSVMEALSLSQLKGYHTGGTLHVVTNNQIGFTTDHTDSRSTNYATDIAKFIGAPIFHVNGDDAESVVFASKLAANYRAKFKKDVVIDVVGYRKYGHNEGDEPAFTQPVMYNIIRNKKNPAELYSQKLIFNSVITESEYENMKIKFKTHLEEEFEKSKTFVPVKADWLEGGSWSKFASSQHGMKSDATGLTKAQYQSCAEVISTISEKDFAVNPKIQKLLELRAQTLKVGVGLDWATCELLAYAALVEEGYHVRMTGQDVERGTFSHRHAVLTDQNTGAKYHIINSCRSDRKTGCFEVKNSNLSEFGVLGFEYGYSITDPNTLTIWEGQFGDFANGAQVVIDQYITSGEVKWLRMSGLALLLPHGYEGQGPEHSSARLERFLQLAADNNIQVANPTTPASIFHLMRRQLHRNFRKPLIIMSPKSLLRHKLVVSTYDDIAEGTSFKPIIDDEKFNKNAEKVKQLVFCSGKVYYDILEKREELARDDIAIVRLEQLYPFEGTLLSNIIAKYKKAKVVWVQEEHKNMGAYNFVSNKIEDIIYDVTGKFERLQYIGRPESASPAVGYMKLHQAELSEFLNKIFNK
jgi:2-oxoglutarate dehydrogenase E1 component